VNETTTRFDSIIADAANLRGTLDAAADALVLAIEQDAAKRRTAREMAANYQDAEAEFTAETMPMLDGRNAEARKVQLDAALVAARRAGVLSRAWAQMNAAAYDADEAKTALEQAAKRFRATEAVAELTTAMLRAIAR
jgi:hypothetical protein